MRILTAPIKHLTGKPISRFLDTMRPRYSRVAERYSIADNLFPKEFLFRAQMSILIKAQFQKSMAITILCHKALGVEVTNHNNPSTKGGKIASYQP